jgi:hypothetical protein
MLTLFTYALAMFPIVDYASANPAGEAPQLSMPIEHVNYTVSTINGELWAVIDGEYPIALNAAPSCGFNGELPMVYPMPPGTGNIHVYLDGDEVAWSNYTQTYPTALHHTAIGDWWMIYAPLSGLSDSFLLKIHYEHPLEQLNGSRLFLYDLNISPYLSPQSGNSTAYFTIRLNATATDLQVYTAPPDSTAREWKPFHYTTAAEGDVQVASIKMYSDYLAPLPGDLVVVFSDGGDVPELPFWALPVLAAAATGILITFRWRINKDKLL